MDVYAYTCTYKAETDKCTYMYTHVCVYYIPTVHCSYYESLSR